MTGIQKKPYTPEVLDSEDDNGTMPENVAELSNQVIGRRIVGAEETVWKGEYRWESKTGLVLSLDDGRKVRLANTSDCCAYTELESFLLDPQMVDHVITGVGTTDGFTTWHIYADLGDVMKLNVGWSSGNPFYYGYGFDISVQDLPEIEARVIEQRAIEGGI